MPAATLYNNNAFYIYVPFQRIPTSAPKTEGRGIPVCSGAGDFLEQIHSMRGYVGVGACEWSNHRFNRETTA